MQIGNNNAEIELIVSNNNSSDGTKVIVDKYTIMGMKLNYTENESNIGADKNIVQCYNLATGKYLLVLGDDDVLLEGSIDKILNILKGGEYGVVYLNVYGFKTDYILERPPSKNSGVTVYCEIDEFINRVNYMFTLLSANIVNKSLIVGHIDPMEFSGTSLLQLNWVFSAMFKATKNIYVEDLMVASKSENSGGYHLCQVFGVNINKIFDVFVKKGINRKYFKIINRKLVFAFFPHFFRINKKDPMAYSFEQEKYFKVLFPLFKGYAFFWLATVPSILLPPKLSVTWQKALNRAFSYGK